MRQIFHNRFLRSYQFSNSAEQAAFIASISAARALSIEESDGQNRICCVARNAITREVEFVLSFLSDLDKDELNIVFWNDRIIFDSGNMVCFVTADLVLQASLELTTPLIGFYIISETKLLILEEAFMRIVDRDGRILKSESFDLISNVAFEKEKLLLCTDRGERWIDIC